MSKTSSAALALAVGAAFGFALSRAIPSAGEHSAAHLPADQITTRTLAILKGPDPLRRLVDLGALLEQLGPDAVPAVTKAFDGAPVDGGDPELVVLVSWWAAFDPHAAFEWTTTDWRAGYGWVTAAVFRMWAHRDPQQALKNLGSLRHPGQLDLAKDALYAGWDESGKPGLWEVFDQLPMRDQQRFAQILARRRVVSEGVDAAIHWADALPTDTLRSLISVRVASAAAETPEGAQKAADWATPQIVAATRPTGFPRRIATRWIKHDPLAAMAWLSTLPAGYDREDGVTEAYRDWLILDFDDAVAWVQKQIAGEIPEWAEPAVSVFAKTNGQARPAESLAIARRFRDPELRDSTTGVLLFHWMKQDRPAAEAWLASSDVSPDLRKRVEVGLAAAAPPGGPGLPHGPLGPPDDPNR